MTSFIFRKIFLTPIKDEYDLKGNKNLSLTTYNFVISLFYNINYLISFKLCLKIYNCQNNNSSFCENSIENYILFCLQFSSFLLQFFLLIVCFKFYFNFDPSSKYSQPYNHFKEIQIIELSVLTFLIENVYIF